MKYAFTILIITLSFCASSQIITTIAGTGSTTNTGDGGAEATATIDLPCLIRFDKSGNLYLTTDVGNSVRKIATNGIINKLVGTGSGGFSGDGGQATAAKLKTTQGIALDTFGNIYIGDAENHRIRKVTIATGIISTIAGTGIPGYNGDSIQATAAMLNDPNGLCFDKKGNLYVADYQNYRVRKIAPSGIITTFAGTNVAGYNGDGGLADTSEIRGVLDLCSDDAGNIYLADEVNGRIRKVDTLGFIHTIAGTGVAAYSGDGGPASAAEVEPHSITNDKFGNIYFGDIYTSRIRKVDFMGVVTTVTGDGTFAFTGDGGLATAAEINTPFGLTTDTCGNLYLCDGHNYRIRKITIDTSCHFSEASLSANQLITSNIISIYPNPTYTSVTISATSKINHITITNLIGQIIYTQAYDIEKAEVNIAGLPDGVYIVRVTDNEGKTTMNKIVKQ